MEFDDAAAQTATKTEAPVDRVQITRLTGVDAFGMKTGHDTVVHVSETLPEWAQHAAVGELLRRLHTATEEYATAGLAAGAAVTIPRQRGVRSVGRRA